MLLLRILYISLIVCAYLPGICLGILGLADLVYALGPFYIKIGQLATTRPDIFPSWLIQALSILQDHVPVGPVVQSDLELPTVPVASGSIAQVYKYKQMAIKIKRSQIKHRLQLDYIILQRVAQFTWIMPVSISQKVLNLIDQTLEDHLDFIQEQENLILASDLNNTQIIIPQLYQTLSNENQIAMQWIDGVSLSQCNSTQLNLVVPVLFQAVYDMIFVHHMVHGDIHEGNILITKDNKIALLDWGLLHIISKEDVMLLKLFLHADVSELSRVMYKWGTGNSVSKAFETDLQEIFILNQHHFYTLLYQLVQIMRQHQVQMKESLLPPLMALASVEGIAQKYTNYSFGRYTF